MRLFKGLTVILLFVILFHPRTLRAQQWDGIVCENYETCLPMANAGNVKAQIVLAGFYLNGDGVLPNDKKALEWYLKAANAGDALAQNLVGVFYYTGGAVEQDYDVAMKWFRKSAAQESDLSYLSQFALGTMYIEGSGVTRNEETALEWYLKGAMAGDEISQYAAAYLYGHGTVVPRDNKLSYAWINTAIETSALKRRSVPTLVAEKERLTQEMSNEDLLEAQDIAERFYKEYVEPYSELYLPQ
jgi:TPR repeat protein